MQISLDCRALKACLVCASHDETRFYLCGVYVEATADAVTYTSTDGHRLLHVRLPRQNDEMDCGRWIIPNDVIKSLKYMKNVPWANLTGEGINLTLTPVGGHGISFKPIEGTFPEYRRVMPHTFTATGDEHYNFQYLADMAKVATILDAGGAQLVRNGDNPAGIVFTRAPSVMGVVMPMFSKACATQAQLRASWAANWTANKL